MDRNPRAERAFLLILCFSFASGAVAGQVLAFRTPDAVAFELRQSLTNYYQRPDADQIGAFPLLLTWFPFPALSFLWGFAAPGVALISLTAALFGFLLSFSAGCFAASFGWEGVLLSAAAIGVRALISLPCFFLISLSSMDRAAKLFRLSSGRVARPDALPALPTRLPSLILCVVILLAGAALDYSVTPRLLRFVLDWIALRHGTGG